MTLMKQIRCNKILTLSMVFVALTINHAYSDDLYRHVSITELLAVPEKFIDKKITVKGYYVRRFGGFLYLSKEHAEFLDNMSKIVVADNVAGGSALSYSGCRNRYVEINGIFKATQYNSFAIFGVKKARAIKLDELCWEEAPRN